jgi:hypothetical protein
MAVTNVAPPAFCAKLAKVLGLLASDHDGEVAAAGRRANALLKGAGLTWDQLLNPPASEPQQQQSRAPRRWRRPASPSDAAALCLQWRDEVLTDWEADFCRSLVGRYRISPKQTVVIERIARKVEAYARATGEA